MSTSQDNNGEDRKDRASALFLRYYHFVEAIAFRAAPSAELQSDIVHDAFLDFMKKADQWDLDSDVRPLLRKITQNIALQYWRNHMRSLPEHLQPLAEKIQEKISANDDQTANSNLDEQLAALDECVERLSPRYRRLVRLFYFEKVPLERLSEETSFSLFAIRKAMCRIRTALRECVERRLAAGERQS